MRAPGRSSFLRRLLPRPLLHGPTVPPCRKILAAALATLLSLGTTLPASALCAGANIFEALPPAEREEIRRRAEAVPFPSRNLWQARRGEERLILVGTYHFDDPRHDATMEALAPHFAEAKLLLVEAGPEEEARLIHEMKTNPALTMILDGPSLIQRLPPDSWERLVTAMEERGVPKIIAARLQPWYATLMLGIAPCMMREGEIGRGLDQRLIDSARTRELPIRALEPYDTLFTLFGKLTDEQIADMLETTLRLEDRSEDMSRTLADLYFAGNARIIWELSRAINYELPGASRDEVDADMALAEEVLLNSRNRDWIAVIEAAAGEGPVEAPVIVGFGAMHLSGQEGVLNLLAKNGWEISALGS